MKVTTLLPEIYIVRQMTKKGQKDIVNIGKMRDYQRASNINLHTKTYNSKKSGQSIGTFIQRQKHVE